MQDLGADERGRPSLMRIDLIAGLRGRVAQRFRNRTTSGATDNPSVRWSMRATQSRGSTVLVHVRMARPKGRFAQHKAEKLTPAQDRWERISRRFP